MIESLKPRLTNGRFLQPEQLPETRSPMAVLVQTKEEKEAPAESIEGLNNAKAQLPLKYHPYKRLLGISMIDMPVRTMFFDSIILDTRNTAHVSQQSFCCSSGLEAKGIPGQYQYFQSMTSFGMFWLGTTWYHK